MVKRACLFESPKTIFEDTITPTAPSTTISTTTAYRKLKVETEADVEKMEAGRVLMQPVVAEPAYPNLVSNIKWIIKYAVKITRIVLLVEFKLN